MSYQPNPITQLINTKMDDEINEVGQNIQQSSLSVLIDVMILRHGDLWTYYGYKLFKCSI